MRSLSSLWGSSGFKNGIKSEKPVLPSNQSTDVGERENSSNPLPIEELEKVAEIALASKKQSLVPLSFQKGSKISLEDLKVKDPVSPVVSSVAAVSLSSVSSITSGNDKKNNIDSISQIDASIKTEDPNKPKHEKKSIISKALMGSTRGVVLNDTLKDVSKDTGYKLTKISKEAKRYWSSARKTFNSSTTVRAFKLGVVDLLESFVCVVFTIVTKLVFLARDFISSLFSLVYSIVLVPLDFILILVHSTFLNLAYKLIDKKRAKFTQNSTEMNQEFEKAANGLGYTKTSLQKQQSEDRKRSSLENLAKSRELFWSGKAISIRAYFVNNIQGKKQSNLKTVFLEDPAQNLNNINDSVSMGFQAPDTYQEYAPLNDMRNANANREDHFAYNQSLEQQPKSHLFSQSFDNIFRPTVPHKPDSQQSSVLEEVNRYGSRTDPEIQDGMIQQQLDTLK